MLIHIDIADPKLEQKFKEIAEKEQRSNNNLGKKIISDYLENAKD